MSVAAIHRFADLERDGFDRVALLSAASTIFRATAARWPDTTEAARTFQYLWLDQYIENEPDLMYLALAPDATKSNPHVVGYLVGCRLNPALSSRFTSLPYFQNFARHCVTHPAHLHVNLDSAFRSQRNGERLVDALCARLRDENIPGVHVVTGREQRNVHFYKRIGFRELARTPRGGTEVLFLARDL